MSESTPSPTRGVPVDLDGETYFLRYSLKTLRQLREEFGEDVLERGEIAGDDVAKFLWYGLRDGHPDLTVEQIEDMVDLQNLPRVIEAVVEATGQRGKLVTASDAAISELNPEKSPKNENPSSQESKT